MVQANQSDANQRMFGSNGSMTTIFEFLPPKQRNKIQQVNKNFYDVVIPRAVPKLQMPQAMLILESGRKKISIGTWRDNIRECTAREILKIGDGEGEISADRLGFSEVYFQYFVHIENRTFVAFPIEQEAILKKGFKVTFDQRWNFQSSEELPESLSDNTMRPTACVLNDGKQLLMMGGRQDRSSQCYDFSAQKWSLTPKLPLGHNITTTITVNWKNQAVFTFIMDAQLSIKSAFLDLENKDLWTDQGTENTSEMEWCKIGSEEPNQLKQTEHKIDRLHIKTGMMLDDGTIAIVGRGRKEGMVEQISGLILYFAVHKQAEGTK